ncbi:hypothetical protein RAA17_11520 [Komagataeibacter rhaeticus]|nr:hypothetical protein [Komagataeibacter rhaeticus]
MSAVITALLRALVRYRVASPRGIAVVRAARRRLARMERADPGNGRLLEVLACLDGIGRTASACVAAMAAGVE